MNLYIFVQIYCIESKNFSITKRERLSKFSTTARTSTRKHHFEQPSRFYIKQYNNDNIVEAGDIGGGSFISYIM